jgi:iron complex transport system ATP-binding protein
MLLREGRIAASGPLTEVITAANLSLTFGLSLAVSHDHGRYTARAR